jgi:DNA-binding Lrp family transcriptional regulator
LRSVPLPGQRGARLGYLEELVDLRFALDEVERQIERLEPALAGLRVAVESEGSFDEDALSLFHSEVRRFESALARVQELRGRLGDVVSFVEAHISRGPYGALTVQEARSIVRDVSEAMDQLFEIWQRLSEQYRLDVLRIEAKEEGRGPTRWADHWPVDAELASKLSSTVLGASERDILMLRLYYEGGRSQTEIADALGLSQPTVAGRLANLEGTLSAEVALSKFSQRFRVDSATARRVQNPSPSRESFRLAVLAREGKGEAVLILPSDRLARRPPLRLDLRRVGRVRHIAVYLLESGDFRLRPGDELADLARELPYATEQALLARFPVTGEDLEQ